MKKRVVAVLLSLTMCSAMVAETGAAALAEPEVTVAAEVGFSDDEESNVEADQNETAGEQSGTVDGTDGGSITVGDPETEGTVEGQGNNITDDMSSGSTVPGTPETEAPQAEVPETEAPAPETEEALDALFSSGEEGTAPEEQIIVQEESSAEVGAAEFETADDEAFTATLLYTRWEKFEKGWKLRKLPKKPAVQESTSADAGNVQQSTAEDQVSDVQTEAVEPEVQPETEAPLTEVQPEAAVAFEAEAEISAKTVEAVPETEVQTAEAAVDFAAEEVPMTEQEPAAEPEIQPQETPADNVGTVVEYYKNALVEVTTVDSQGKTLSKGTYYFDDYGYMLTGRRYIKPGVQGYKRDSQGEYYFLELSRAKITDPNTAAGSAITPFNSEFGQMQTNCWATRHANGMKQWRYFGKDGLYQKMPVGAYKLLEDQDIIYLLDGNGYIIKNKLTKAADGYYYYANAYGRVYRNRLLKLGRYRYYFTSSGKRATWRNRWVRLGNQPRSRYYYFGNVPGRVQEKRGLQKIVIKNKFVGWFYFTPGGNNVQNYWMGDRYYLPDGRMASGVTKVGKYYYFFERSSTTQCRGKRYKGKWIKYNNKYYYAASNGVLAANGWRTIRGGRYYFQNCTAVTNRRMKDPKTNKWGWLDSRGRYATEWIIMDDAKNRARYMDPETGYVLKNTTKTIDGVNYRFDKYGNRVNDRTNEFRQRSYYLECDRVNGLITVYTNTRKNVPIKTVRVSVGNPWTPTPLMNNERIDRADRWQMLMGPSWGQYGTHVRGGIYIHSIACGQRHGNNLPAGEYLKLGNPASHGCIRCCVADAKWIWENCNGSRITVFDGKYNPNETFKGPLGRNPLKPLRGSGTFDPTDPEYM